ncbi:MAG: amidohydrolase family protein [Labilithrix sp.]|nr:amidohydrolase family protein [Labilithrix sp.]
MAVRIFHADHVLPGDAPPIADGAVVVDAEGAIVEVGAAAEVLPRHAGPAPERVRGVVFPGLVNAHTHVELSSMRGKVPGGHGFVPWVDRLVTTRSECSPDEDAEEIERAVDALAMSATVAVGDVTNSLAAVAALARRGIGGSVFHEVLGMDRAVVLRRVDGLRAELAERVPTWPGADLAYAPAPHTLFTLHHDAARALLESAERRGVRTSLHLAEHAAERRAVEHGEGPVPEWFATRFKQRPEWPKRPLFDLAAEVGALRPHVILVHLADARADELARVAAAGAPVVLCPRSNLYIEGRLPPLLAVRAAGIEPALGTDSLASNTSLDVLAEARALADRFPSVPKWELVKMATWNGARALGREDLGRLARGARPGVFCVEGAAPGDPAALLLASRAPRRVLVARVPRTGASADPAGSAWDDPPPAGARAPGAPPARAPSAKEESS